MLLVQGHVFKSVLRFQKIPVVVTAAPQLDILFRHFIKAYLHNTKCSCWTHVGLFIHKATGVTHYTLQYHVPPILKKQTILWTGTNPYHHRIIIHLCQAASTLLSLTLNVHWSFQANFRKMKTLHVKLITWLTRASAILNYSKQNVIISLVFSLCLKYCEENILYWTVFKQHKFWFPNVCNRCKMHVSYSKVCLWCSAQT